MVHTSLEALTFVINPVNVNKYSKNESNLISTGKLNMMANLKFHIAMFPWFAYGHMTPYLHLSNKLAERGHTVSFLLPRGAQPKIEQLSLHPDLIHFFPLDVPHVDGLPPGAETASDVPFPSHTHLATAFDQTRDQVETILTTTLIIKPPNFIFFDFGSWVPALATDLGIKSIYYGVVSAATHARALVPSFKIEKNWTPAQLVQTPPGYPSPKVKLKEQEAGLALVLVQEMGSGLTLYERLTRSMKECDAIAMRTCCEIEGPFCDYIAQQYNKPVHLTGHVLPDNTHQPEKLEEPWAEWLSKFKPKSVVYCALGSQNVLNKEQFQEMVLGFELTQLPFLVALKPPQGCETVEEALPDGFKERVEGRGLVHGGWVPQPGILGHQSVGCFVSHCGFGSMWESLLSECQIVLVPADLGDHITCARLMVEELKVAVEVEKENNNSNGKWWFTKDGLCKAIKSMMDEESKIGCELKSNHAKWKEIVSSKTMETGYIDSFVQKLQHMLD